MIIWQGDIPFPAINEEEFIEEEDKSESYEDSDWYNDPNCPMSHWHY